MQIDVADIQLEMALLRPQEGSSVRLAHKIIYT